MQEVELFSNRHGYMILDWLGSGAMGDVYKCIDQNTGNKVALKWLRRLDLIRRFDAEAQTLRTLDHPNIAHFINYVQNQDYAFIVMEYVEGLTLEKLVNHQGKLPEMYALKIMKQLASAIKYLHDHKVIHRDLKAANIKIMQDSTIKVLDFGIAKTQWSEKLTAEGLFVGSMPYIAPEQFREITSSKIDSWALGIIFYQMITRYLPFTADNEVALRFIIEKGKYLAPEIFEPALSRQSKNIIKQLLCVNPNQRWSVDELLDTLNNSEHVLKNGRILHMLKNWLIPN